MSPSTKEIVLHIKTEAYFLYESCLGQSLNSLLANEILKRAVVRSLEIIGEATKRLPDDLTIKYPLIEWKEMAGMRDILIHHYFGIDYNVVWDVLSTDIPKLKETIDFILTNENI